jgi:hypothetical protein
MLGWDFSPLWDGEVGLGGRGLGLGGFVGPFNVFGDSVMAGVDSCYQAWVYQQNGMTKGSTGSWFITASLDLLSIRRSFSLISWSRKDTSPGRFSKPTYQPSPTTLNRAYGRWDLLPTISAAA